jgi:hypothetical protein
VHEKPSSCFAFAALLVLAPALASGRTVQIPMGTVIYGETDQRVTSRIKKDGTDVGDMVSAHVWRDVVVDGQVVVKAGTPMMVRVSEVKKAKLAGIRGSLELEAFSTTAMDGQDVPLEGGYDKSGHGRMALSITLAAVVALPLIFIHGKPAILEAGTVFDARAEMPVKVELESNQPRKIDLSDAAGGGGDLTVEVLYDEMDPAGKDKRLPVNLRNCSGKLAGAAVVSVGDEPIPRLPLVIGEATTGDGCETARATVDLAKLGKHLRKGINRFEIEASGARAEVVLDIEL